MPLNHCWAFECGSIQAFILETGRLADAVGASLLIDRLTGDLDEAAGATASLLQCVLNATKAEVEFSRRGGGSFIAFFASATARSRVRQLWHAALLANVPGLRWADAVADGPTPQAAAGAALRQCQQAARLDRPRLPEAGPLCMRVQRTGQPAVATTTLAGGHEALDAATVVRRRHGRKSAVADTLLQRFGHREGLRWPRNMDAEGDSDDDGRSDAFPFLAGSKAVAFLHADGNGLGVLLRQLDGAQGGEGYMRRYAAFSRAVSAATVAAAQHASAAVLLPAARDGLVPARPLVLGGDDLTVIVRADLALPFAEAFLRAFETASSQQMAGLRQMGLQLPGL